MTAAGRKTEIDELLGRAAELEAEGRAADALEQAWQALDLESGDLNAKRVIARLLRRNPDLVSTERRPDVERLLTDPDVDPDAVASAGWTLLLAELGAKPRAMAERLEDDGLAIALLTEACVCSLEAEQRLREVRRWLLLSGRSSQYPRLVHALVAQAWLNGGAWPFGEDERAVLQQSPDLPFAAAYVRPPRPSSAERFDDAVTQTVADQYARWPYPAWTRFTPPQPTTLPRAIEKFDGNRPSGLPVRADVLVAGCGTGREAGMLAKRFPDARITAIDVSPASLAYAERQCEGLAIDFRLLDLHDVAELGRRFDHVACSGVLHHLPDPEAGWAKLVEVLNPGGVMKVMVYSRVARLRVEAARIHIADLLDRPADDDLLREVRRRLIEKLPDYVGGIADFFNLDGVHDLLLNRHEDPFNVQRIARSLDHLGLELLAFKLPTQAEEARYRREHPKDPLFRDVEAWANLEKTQPFLFAGMYEFWCRAA